MASGVFAILTYIQKMSSCQKAGRHANKSYLVHLGRTYGSVSPAAYGFGLSIVSNRITEEPIHKARKESLQ